MNEPVAPVLQGENLCFSYSSGASKGKRVLDGVSLAVHPGELLCLLGPSGCGKSTLVRCLASLLPLDSGVLKFRGQGVEQPSPGRFVVYQDTHQLLPWLTCEGNVAFAEKHAAGVHGPGAALRFLRLVGMEKQSDSFPHELSGGMRQRVALARALSAGGELLLLDEPFGSLDALTREELQDLLLRIREETSRSFILVTHDLREAAYLADRVLVMGFAGRRVSERRVALDRPRERDGEGLLREVHSLRRELSLVTDEPPSDLSQRR